MAIVFVRGIGDDVSSPAAVLMYASGVVRNGMVVDFSRTGGVGVTPAGASSTATTIFGVCLDYAQGASDTLVRCVPFVQGQLYQADCTDIALTAQIGLRHVLNADGVTIRNTSSDVVTTATGVFHAIAMVGATTGSGKLLGFFDTLTKGAQNTTTFN